MATAAQLKALRRKHGLGEFRKKKRRRKTAYRVRHRRYHKANRKYGPLRRRRSKRTGSASRYSPLGTTSHFPGGPQGSIWAEWPDPVPTEPTNVSGALSPLNRGIVATTTTDELVRYVPDMPGVGVFRRADGTLYKAKIE